MSDPSTAARYIRERIFCVHTQQEFAQLLGYSQATISRVETGEMKIGPEYQSRVRSLARRMQIKWDNNYFFEVPQQPRRRVA